MKNRPSLLRFLFCLFAFALIAVRAFDIAAAGTVPQRASGGSRSASPGSYVLYLPLLLKNYPITTGLWRFGAANVRNSILGNNSMNVEAMRFGWYTDFRVSTGAPDIYGMEYVPTVRIKQLKVVPSNANFQSSSTWCKECAFVQPYTYTLLYNTMSELQSMASARRGKTWLIGNEMERRDWINNDNSPGYQDEMLPEVYALAYHDLYVAIKGADPTAQIAIGGMVEATPLRLEYLNSVWSAYSQAYGQTMPVDIWNIHAFILQERRNDYGADIPTGLSETAGVSYTILDNRNFAKVAEQINLLRTWMQQHGQQNKPLYISEYGVLYSDWVSPGDFTAEIVRDNFMNSSFSYFLNQTDTNLGYPADSYRLVQRWSWYSIDDDSGFMLDNAWAQNFNGNLYYSGIDVSQSGYAKGIAPLGTYWKQYVQPLGIGYIKPY